jgi:hypothetical protein
MQIMKSWGLYDKVKTLLKEGFPILFYFLRAIKNRVTVQLNSSHSVCVLNLVGDRDVEWSWIAALMPLGPAVMV